jgi:TRAP-type C4-dicarboxylate transport system permease small subunit
MARVLSLHDAITRSGYQLATLIVILIAGSYCYEVAARYFFNSPTDWANAAVAYLLCAVIFLTMPEQTRRRAHIAITIVVDRAGPVQRRRWQTVIAGVSAATCLAVFYVSANETWIQFRDGLLTVATYEIPKWWVSIFIPYGLLSSALYFLREALDPDAAPPPEIVRQ